MAATAAKKGKVQQSICQDDDGPTPEELRRRHMRAGRFGGGAVDHSVPPRINVPVYAVSAGPAATFYIMLSCACSSVTKFAVI